MSRPTLSLELNGLAGLSTANIADAAVRLTLPIRQAPADLRPLQEVTRLIGQARPVKHAGSVDVFLEAIALAYPGDVLVIDNQGKTTEGAIGDLIVHEAKAAGLAGIILWGMHRDTSEILSIDFPVWSLGSCPVGPTRVEKRPEGALKSATVGDHTVTDADIVIADLDGILFLPRRGLTTLVAEASAIRDQEHLQAERLTNGTSLRRQLDFETYLERRNSDPNFTFRAYLREVEGAIET